MTSQNNNNHVENDPVETHAPNLRYLVSWRRRITEYAVAAFSGLLISFTFPPLELDWIAWVALIPILLLPVPLVKRRRIVIGIIFGLSYFIPSLFWLNEIGFAAGILLAVICAFFPAAWYVLFGACAANFPFFSGENQDKPDENNPKLPPSICFSDRPLIFAFFSVAGSASWVALEWVRSWLFTGFPWDLLGVSQWQHTGLLSVTAFTGVYGLSFLLVSVNFTIAWVIAMWSKRWQGRKIAVFPWPVLVAVVVLMLAVSSRFAVTELGKVDKTLNVVGIQGNLTQRRQWNEELLDEAINVYDSLTRKAASTQTDEIDLIVWPETALPAPVQWNDKCVKMLKGIFRDYDINFLIGSLAYRPESEDSEHRYEQVNSVIHLGPDGKIQGTYDKTHLVPFGEYVPFGNRLPWLRDIIGMGRDLRAGQNYNPITLPGNVQAGINICYEDVFPNLSRKFVGRGADLLMTLTNDAWYAESAGSRQHMIHAVFRAAENRRPLFRSGNNSDTCLILPNGEVQGLLYDSSSGNRFVRGFRRYKVPVWEDAPLTFYTQFGDVFAVVCTIVGVSLAILCFAFYFMYKEKCRNRIAPN